jgi:adenosylcobyric acid synthase
VVVRFVTRPEELADADLVVLPGTRATVADLAWSRENGIADAVLRRAAAGQPVLGICGGYQMLAGVIDDEVESRRGTVPALGLLPTTVHFGLDKVLGRPAGRAYGQPVEGYEIRHGRVSVSSGDSFLDGCRSGSVWGTSWHGIFENDGFRRAFLAEVATVAGRRFVPGDVDFSTVRQQWLDITGDLVADNLDTDQVLRLLADGPPAGLPFVPPGAPDIEGENL